MTSVGLPLAHAKHRPYSASKQSSPRVPLALRSVDGIVDYFGSIVLCLTALAGCQSSTLGQVGFVLDTYVSRGRNRLATPSRGATRGAWRLIGATNSSVGRIGEPSQTRIEPS